MAEKPGSDEAPIELRQKIARSRELVVRDMDGMRYELDFPLKFRKAFQRNTVLWVGAALAVGLALALLRARPQKVYVSRGGKKIGFDEQDSARIRRGPGAVETRDDIGAADGGELFREAGGEARWQGRRQAGRQGRHRTGRGQSSLVTEFPFTPGKRLPIL